MNDGVIFWYCEESFCSAYYLEGDSSLTEDPTEGALSYALTGRVVNPLKVGLSAYQKYLWVFVLFFSSNTVICECSKVEIFSLFPQNFQKNYV